MDRRRALVLAGTITAVTLAAVLAVGATFGLFGLARADGGPGSFDPASAATSSAPESTEQIVIVDVPAPGPPPDQPGSGAAGPAPQTSVASPPTSDGSGSDDRRGSDSSGSGRSGSGRSGSDRSGSGRSGSDDSGRSADD